MKVTYEMIIIYLYQPKNTQNINIYGKISNII